MIKDVDLINNDGYYFFYTSNCGTCKVAFKMIEIIDNSDFKGIFYKINATDKKDLLNELKIKSIPALVVVNNKEVEDIIYNFSDITKILNN